MAFVKLRPYFLSVQFLTIGGGAAARLPAAVIDAADGLAAGFATLLAFVFADVIIEP